MTQLMQDDTDYSGIDLLNFTSSRSWILSLYFGWNTILRIGLPPPPLDNLEKKQVINAQYIEERMGFKEKSLSLLQLADGAAGLIGSL